MSKRNIPELWKLIIYPLVTFIIIFGTSRSLVPLLKDWTWKATVVGIACGLIAAFIHIIILFFRRE